MSVFLNLFENLEEPSSMPKLLALTGITVHIKSITSNDKNKNVYKWFRIAGGETISYRPYVLRVAVKERNEICHRPGEELLSIGHSSPAYQDSSANQ